KQGGGEIGSVAGGCGQLGVCDDPVVRDAFIPAPTTPENVYRLHIHVFCQDNGAACTSTVAEVNNQINTLNNNYAPWRISFEYDLSFHNDSVYWSWASSEEAGMKSTYAVDPATKLNIYLVNVEGQFSFGTFPWDPDALTFMGGVVMNNGQWSSTATTIAHEIGHNLGLWHTHHGVSEVNQCSACWESPNAPDSTVGDRCADTAPTPTNFNCGPPGGVDPCGGGSWGATDFHNYMSYSNCRTEFTPQQAGRLHCWTNDVVSSWLLPQCTATYDVLLDTVNPPINAVCTGTADPFCDPGFLDCATTYYWQVAVTSDLTGMTTVGPVWFFTTPFGPDCNANGTADVCDIGTGVSGDCNTNAVPDECETDCQANGVADECDISQGTSQDCDANNVPDECDPDADADGVPDGCDICAGGNDTLDADGDGVPNFCDICAGGDDTLDTDFDGVPDFCDACPLDNPDDPDGDGICTSNDNCALSNPLQLDCQPNGVGDVCDLDAGTSNDDNANGIPDECEIAIPMAPDELGVGCVDDAGCTNLAVCRNAVCYVPKNRYVSIGINPANGGRDTARRLAIDSGGTPLVLGWVGPPDANGICRVQADPYYADWSLAGPVSLGDCAIAPGRSYLIQAIPAGMDISNEANYSVSLALPTAAIWGDVGGSVTKGLLQPPDGSANFSDIQAIVAEFQGIGQAPRVWLDLDGETPDYEVGFGDIQRAVFGFQNVGYSFSDPCSCVGLTPCP
ncbi:MAG: M43 family zinc metalloprotease, partial [Phycisphaerae bacterium]